MFEVVLVAYLIVYKDSANFEVNTIHPDPPIEVGICFDTDTKHAVISSKDPFHQNFQTGKLLFIPNGVANGKEEKTP